LSNAKQLVRSNFIKINQIYSFIKKVQKAFNLELYTTEMQSREFEIHSADQNQNQDIPMVKTQTHSQSLKRRKTSAAKSKDLLQKKSFKL